MDPIHWLGYLEDVIFIHVTSFFSFFFFGSGEGRGSVWWFPRIS